MTVIPASLKTLFSRRIVPALGISVLFAASSGAQVFINQPISPAADVNHVLVTAPFCASSGDPFGVYDITSGSPVLFSDLTSVVTSKGSTACQEIGIAISPGLKNFPAGAIYVAYQLANFDVQVASIPPGGGAPTVFVDLGNATSTATSLGITFDQVGSFSNDMIVTTGTGQIFTINSSGAFVMHQITGGMCCGVELENPNVAPLLFSSTYGGYLFATGESPSSVFAVQPGTFMATALPAGGSLSPRPEGLAFSSDAPVCSVLAGPTGSKQTVTLIDAVYGSNQVNFYNPTQADAGFVNSEFAPYTLNYLNSDGTLGTQIASFSASDSGQQEHLAAVTCLPPPPSLPGRMTGGGSFFPPDGTRVTHGLELHCSVPSHPNTLEINWGGGNNFHLDNLTNVTCFLDPAISQGHPSADFNTMVGGGTGTLNGSPATIEFEFTDAGEPGVNDEASITIQQGTFTFFVPLTTLDNGNQQAHK